MRYVIVSKYKGGWGWMNLRKRRKIELGKGWTEYGKVNATRNR